MVRCGRKGSLFGAVVVALAGPTEEGEGQKSVNVPNGASLGRERKHLLVPISSVGTHIGKKEVPSVSSNCRLFPVRT